MMSKKIIVLIFLVFFATLSYFKWGYELKSHKFESGVTTNDTFSQSQEVASSDYNQSIVGELDLQFEIGISNYEQELSHLISSQEKSNRLGFIKEQVEKMNYNSLDDIISVFQRFEDERSAERVISRAILSEISDDRFLDVLFDETTGDETLLPDFVSATLFTNSQNSFNRLMEMQTMSFDESVLAELLRGTITMYQNSVTSETGYFISNWLGNNALLNVNQERIVINFLKQLPDYIAISVIDENLAKFTQEHQEELQFYVRGIPERGI